MLLSRTAKYLALHVYSSLHLGLALSGENPFHIKNKFTNAINFSASQNYKSVLWEGNR